MNRKIFIIFTLIAAVLLTSTACDKITSLTANTNKAPEYIDPFTQLPAEVQAFAPPTVGRFTRIKGEKKDKLDKIFNENDEGSKNLFNGAEHYRIKYNYTDGRYKEYSTDKNDLELNIYKIPPAENVRKYIENWETAAKKKMSKMRVCKFEEMSEHGATDVGPPQIIKRLKHPNGNDVIFVQRGFLIYNKCYDDNAGIDSEAYWIDGSYLTEAHSIGYHDSAKQAWADAFPIIEDFVTDYIAAVGQSAK